MDYFIYIWIEGERNLLDFCNRHFGLKPRWSETIGYCAPATIHEIYKHDTDGGRPHHMFLMYMPDRSGKSKFTESQITNEIERQTYAEIKAHRTALLK